MQVYIKYQCVNNRVGWETQQTPFIKYIPFTKESGLSYKDGKFKTNTINICIDDVIFATIQFEHAEGFVNYFLTQTHKALSIDDGAFVVYDGKELVDKYFKEGARKHEWFK